MTPYVGMPVLVPMPDGEEAYGIVSRVWTDDNVSVRVFGDDNEVGWRPGVTLKTDREMDDKGKPVDDPMTVRVHPGDPAQTADTDATADTDTGADDDEAETPIATSGKRAKPTTVFSEEG